MQPTSSARLVLASSSPARAALLRQAGLDPLVRPVRIDEDALRKALIAEGSSADDLAALLAEAKARRGAGRDPQALVIGADQILECDGRIFAKPADPAEACKQIAALSGRTHQLLSAAVVCQGATALWRHTARVRLTMHPLDPAEIAEYVARHWPAIAGCVGAYRIEAEGVRLFSRIEGDYFAILGLPLIELLTWLRNRGDIAA
ncbi:MAG: septum formation protein Maf [Alphaproteobacteria bacterium HGW-Alphaproteobacteria-6]|nr:MAG: septum formation protein Maf [Alphaproteobacteria bacterium HGW-Alphaproteobacteria-6]